MDATRAITTLPPFWNGVKKNHVSIQKDFELCAFDTETFFGRVFASGFYSRNGFRICYGLNRDHISFFIDCVLGLGNGDRSVICGVHYLVFDLSVLFWEILNPRLSKASRAPRHSFFSLLASKAEIEIFWGKPCFAKVKRNGQTVHLLDTFAFFTMSLSRALSMIGASVRKLKKPKNLGKRLISKRELVGAGKNEGYLVNDVKGCYEIVQEIQRLHSKYGVRFCVSLPQMSGRIFRHYYVNKDFPAPARRLITASMLSYHGGKNVFNGLPGWHKDCYDLDINSAYPEAMAQLPDFENGQWVYGSGPEFFSQFKHGIFRLSGQVKACPWGVIFDHGFKKLTGDFQDIWTTSYEIRSALKHKELRIHRICGYGFLEDRSAKQDHAFKRFVFDFYRLKSGAKTKTEGYFYKLILNSLYGKFIQRTQDEDGQFVAGGMFDPSIASLITGFVRARIHGLEHRYKAIHTATDGFITKIPPKPLDIGVGIGRLKQETFGPVLILRNKLYLHFEKVGGRLAKSGLHGFEGNADDLEKIWKSSKRVYHIRRLVRWAEAWHIGLPPGSEIKRNKVLKLSC